VVLVREPVGDELLPAIVRRVSEEALTIVPVSGDAHLATEWDLLLPQELMGYPAMAQVWNFGTVLPEQIVEVVASLAAGENDRLDMLAAAIRRGDRPAAGLPVGIPILDDADPRLLDQEQAAELVRPFWGPALALAGAETLGQLVHHRREELGVATDELESLADTRNWLDAFEGDRLDVRRTLGSSALAALLRRLGVTASRRLGRIALWTVEAQQPSLARNAERRAGDDVPSAEDYVAQMLDELEHP
jgi:hypothetical protein